MLLLLGDCRLNAAEMLVDVEKSKGNTNVQWLSESGIVDLFIFPGPTPAKVCNSSCMKPERALVGLACCEP